MVLCKFFQQGSCRFGTKCQNEHFDIKQLLKADIESALNGNQWPFSSFGPFKDKPCIPNFITDQSFEEMRLLCYEARQKNYFEQFHQQFSREAMDAKNKMKTLLELSPAVIDLVTNIYDSDSAGGGATVNKTSNPFGLNNGSAGNTAAGSLFAKPTPALGGGNVFGVAGGFNASAGGGTSLFGGGNTAQQNSIFAQQQAAKPTNPIFGGGAPAAQNQTNPLFGQQQMNANAMGGSAVGGGGGLFAQAAQQSAPLFGQQQNTGLFRQAMQQPQQASGNIFAHAVQQQPLQQQQPTIFAQAAAQQQMPQISHQQTQQQAGTNIFAQAAQQMQPPPQQAGLFQQAIQQPQQTSLNSQQMQLQQQQQAQQLPPTQSVYSRMEDLTAEDIEAFKADAFMPGKIPFSPPPREMIN